MENTAYELHVLGIRKGPDSFHENGCKPVPPFTPSASFGKVNWIHLKTWSGLDLGSPVESLPVSFCGVATVELFVL